MIELLSTKKFIPRPRKVLVTRPRLVDCLNAGLEKNLTLIAAPAGFWKTTLLDEVLNQRPKGTLDFLLQTSIGCILPTCSA